MAHATCDVYGCSDRAYLRTWFEMNMFFGGRPIAVAQNLCGTHAKRREVGVLTYPVIQVMLYSEYLKMKGK